MGVGIDSLDNNGTLVGQGDRSQLLVSHKKTVNASPSKHIFLDPRSEIFNKISFNFAGEVCRKYIKKFLQWMY